jgi:hypothetical protein
LKIVVAIPYQSPNHGGVKSFGLNSLNLGYSVGLIFLHRLTADAPSRRRNVRMFSQGLPRLIIIRVSFFRVDAYAALVGVSEPWLAAGHA